MSAKAIADHDRTQAVARTPDVVAQALSQTPKRPEVISFSNRPEVRGFFDERTYSVQYVVSDPAAHRCAIIDPVLDFDERVRLDGDTIGGCHSGLCPQARPGG
jgi:hypothetical protein